MTKILSGSGHLRVGRPGFKTAWERASNSARRSVRRLYVRDPAKGETALIGTKYDAVKNSTAAGSGGAKGFDLAGGQSPTTVKRARTAPAAGSGNATKKRVSDKSTSRRVDLR